MTTARYSIWVRERGSDHDVELLCVDSNPEPLKAALYEKRIKIGKGKKAPQYDYIRVVDNEQRG